MLRVVRCQKLRIQSKRSWLIVAEGVSFCLHEGQLHLLCRWKRKSFSEERSDKNKKTPWYIRSRFAGPKLKYQGGLNRERERYKQFRPYEVEMSIPCCVCTKVQKNGNLRRNQGRYRENIETIMQAERNRDNRSRVVSHHVHMLISIPPKYSVSQIMGYLKGKSSLMIFGLTCKFKV